MCRIAYVLVGVLLLLGSTVPASAADDCTGAAVGDPCDDGIFCNGNDQCGQFGGAWGCLFHSGDPCVGGPQCANTCDEGANSCFLPRGTPCDDGLFCTADDTCNGAGECTDNAGDPCTGGPECADECDEERDTCNLLQGSPCTDDDNACTDDLCNGLGQCAHIDNDDPCDDGVFCNGNDNCEGGLCSLHTGDPCADGADCANDCSEEGGGTCLAPVGTPCDDGLFCNGPDTCDGEGKCAEHGGDPCAGGPECANDCSEEGGGKGNCFVAEGTPCTDEGNICTDDECNGTGVCARVPNNEPCDDGLFCNGADHCGAGSCILHTGDPCAGGPECALMCDEQGDACATPFGIPCSSDGNPCTDDVCLNGQCTHSTVTGCQVCSSDGDCDDDNPCTSDACKIDGCENTLIFGCVACSQDDDCDDGEPCTVDTCGGDNQCSHSGAACFTSVTCPFVGGLEMEACAGERIPRTIARLIDRAGCKAEQAEMRARDGRRRVAKKLKVAQRSLNRAVRKVKQASGRKLSAPCVDAILAELADRSARITALVDRGNGGTQLGACTDALTTDGITSAQAMGPSLCGKR